MTAGRRSVVPSAARLDALTVSPASLRSSLAYLSTQPSPAGSPLPVASESPSATTCSLAPPLVSFAGGVLDESSPPHEATARVQATRRDERKSECRPQQDPTSPALRRCQNLGSAPRRRAGRRLSLWTAMKEGLLGDRLGVSSRSEHEEARSYVARWIGSESTSARRLPARRCRRARRAHRRAAGCRRLAPPRRAAARASGCGR